MTIKVSNGSNNIITELKLTGSKSETNRLLILQALFPNLNIENESNSEDTAVLKKALQKNNGILDIHHAGTAMRFLTAYFATKKGSKVELTGSDRMKERPVQLLVEALKRMGGNIVYQEESGFPPLLIVGKELQQNSVKLKANISSQYISALMLVGASLKRGLKIELEGRLTSKPYILMTLEILKKIGITCSFDGKTVLIEPAASLKAQTFSIESDWSSASYFYSLVAISENAEISLSTFKKNSLQGDSCLVEIYREFGVETVFKDNKIHLKKVKFQKPKRFSKDLRNSPDIAQTIAVTCLALGIECVLTGLHTLKIKETDRLQALKNEMEKFGAEVRITKDSLSLLPPKNIAEHIKIETYNDHRMAMAFAPLALMVPLEIEDAEVVAKSYPDFWEDFKKLGLLIQKID